MERRSWNFLGRRGPAGPFNLRTSKKRPIDTAATAPLDEVGLELADPKIAGEDPLDYVFEPLMVLDSDGNIVAANLAARTFIDPLEIKLGGEASVEQVLANVRVANGGGSPPWVPISGTTNFDTMVSSSEPLTDRPIFELRTKPRASAGKGKAGWIVRLVDVTPLITALREQRSARDQRDQLLNLLSHDMRTPLAAILTTLRHPDLGAMPENPRRIIEKAAHRALHMVDHNARMIRAQCSDYAFAALDLIHIVEEVLDDVWSLSKAAGVRLVLLPSNDELMVLADRGSLTDALTDLVKQLLNTSRAGCALQCELRATVLNGRPAVTLFIGEVYDKQAKRPRLPTPTGTASGFENMIGSSDDTNGVAFLKTVVARHSGIVVLERAQGAGRRVSITIPAAETDI